MGNHLDIIALVFDFDDTLVPDSTTFFLNKLGIDTDTFWQGEVKALLNSGYDPTLAYLWAMIEKIGEDKPLGLLTNADLAVFGSELTPLFHPGLVEMLDELKILVSRDFKDIRIEYYIVSGGLQDIIAGNTIVQKYFTATYGCLFGEGGSPTRITHVKRAINFTEKTRYIFEINKGVSPEQTYSNPYLVNKDVPTHSRRIPMRNIIYIGDGLTDIPCFSLIHHSEGKCFGVVDPANPARAKRALSEFLEPKRVLGMYAPLYDSTHELGSFIRAAVSNRCAEIVLERSMGNYRR